MGQVLIFATPLPGHTKTLINILNVLNDYIGTLDNCKVVCGYDQAMTLVDNLYGFTMEQNVVLYYDDDGVNRDQMYTIRKLWGASNVGGTDFEFLAYVQKSYHYYNTHKDKFNELITGETTVVFDHTLIFPQLFRNKCKYIISYSCTFFTVPGVYPTFKHAHRLGLTPSPITFITFGYKLISELQSNYSYPEIARLIKTMCIYDRAIPLVIFSPKLIQPIADYISENYRVKYINPIQSKPVISRRKYAERRTIYISLGTTYNPVKMLKYILKKMLKCVKTLPTNIKVIISMGKNNMKGIDPDYTRLLNIVCDSGYNDRVYVKSYVNQSQILKDEAMVMITHCGFNSLNECCKYLVPVIGVPIAVDQKLNNTNVIKIMNGVYLRNGFTSTDLSKVLYTQMRTSYDTMISVRDRLTSNANSSDTLRTLVESLHSEILETHTAE